MADLIAYFERDWHPIEYHCWSLVQDYYARELDIDLPAVAVDANALRQVRREFRSSPIFNTFEPVSFPEDHDVVIFDDHSGESSHCGIYLAGRILHNFKGFGVAHVHPVSLRHQFPSWTYWRHVSRSSRCPLHQPL